MPITESERSDAGRLLCLVVIVLGEVDLSFPDRISFQFELVGVVDEAIEDRIGEGWVGDTAVPLLDGQLAGDQR